MSMQHAESGIGRRWAGGVAVGAAIFVSAFSGGCNEYVSQAEAAPIDVVEIAPAKRDLSLVVHRNSVGMELVRIPAGTFLMGSPLSEAGRQPVEGPRREIRISRDFLMGRTEVTNAQFEQFIAETGYTTEAERDEGGGFGIDFTTGRVVQASGMTWRNPGFPGFEPGPDHPVLLVSWNDAKAFCEWLSAKEGVRYRLPTEAEWEYAARGGTTTARYSGEDPESLSGVANVADASLRAKMPRDHEAWNDGFPFLAPVGSFEPNAFGLYDMLGNVWEWCEDEWDDLYFHHVSSVDPLVSGTPNGGFRAIRGGGWLDRADRVRAAQRVWFEPTFRFCLLSGFRVVMELD